MKSPSFGKDNLDFKSKREAILNKCSFDLIVLLIEESKRQRAELHHKGETTEKLLICVLIGTKKNLPSCALNETTENLLSCAVNAQEMEEWERIFSADVNKCAKEVAKVKHRTFQRDEQDNRDGSVYPWTQRLHGSSKPGHGCPFSLPSRASTSEDVSSQVPSTDLDFLEKVDTGKPPKRGKQGGKTETQTGRQATIFSHRPVTGPRPRDGDQYIRSTRISCSPLEDPLSVEQDPLQNHPLSP
ncbi:hypothetical protein AALO_G00142630 [Alosa alosa]|uniref:Uncharacterized protein n=1 Tax=Alosa alosa TaxID=278164 RepID=A0AAV6GMS8_9TELE|nr:hypothetical protein AALO_G00142630 [Alosa alosa]